MDYKTRMDTIEESLNIIQDIMKELPNESNTDYWMYACNLIYQKISNLK